MNNGLSMEKTDKAELDKLHRDIEVICDYLYYDEEKHYEESGRPRNHIWRYIKRTKQWLRKQRGIGGVSQ